MMYEEIKKDMPEEYELEPVIIKLERQRVPVIVVCHEVSLHTSSQLLFLEINNLKLVTSDFCFCTGCFESIICIFCS
ncbi:putative 6-phosphofructo-2-kinase, Fructose-2,6-bisphosphate 2-phosphatase [Helianthus anomalus]